MSRQMGGASKEVKCASSAEPRAWTRYELDRARKWVGKLQRRIAKAQREKKYNKAKALQHLLVTSRAAKITAVERVTSNKGKRTAGVDGVTWQTNAAKAKAIGTLRRRGYKPKPLKRVYIPKKNGKKRPLGIPTMKDRAMQALYQMALEPIAETTADRNSYGFRKHRGCQDAIDALHRWLSRRESPEWVLEGDIKGCFDHISHEWLVRNVRTDSEILRKWLTSGVIYNRLLTPTTEGTPQGGIISPTLANLTLDGMERLVKSRYPSCRPKGTKGKWQTKKVNLVRYADDFIVTAADKDTLLEIKAMLTAFLAERGLELSEEKTLITHITEGFDFLGFNIRKYNGKLIIKPSKKSQERLVEKLHETIYRWNKAATQEALIDTLNPIRSAHRHAQPDTARMGKLQPTCVLQGGVLQDRPHHRKPTHEVGLPQAPEEGEALDQPQVLHQRRAQPMVVRLQQVLHQRRAQPMDVRLQVHDGRRGKDLPPPATCRCAHRAPRQGEGRCESFRPRMGRIFRQASRQGKPPKKG